MHHDSIDSRPSEGFDYFEISDDGEGSETSVHSKPGIGNSEAVPSPSTLFESREDLEFLGDPAAEPDNDPPPGIEGLQIVGDHVLGDRLTACGHPVNGTYLCIFQVCSVLS